MTNDDLLYFHETFIGILWDLHGTFVGPLWDSCKTFEGLSWGFKGVLWNIRGTFVGLFWILCESFAGLLCEFCRTEVEYHQLATKCCNSTMTDEILIHFQKTWKLECCGTFMGLLWDFHKTFMTLFWDLCRTNHDLWLIELINWSNY